LNVYPLNIKSTRAMCALMVAWALAFVPAVNAQAAVDQPSKTTASARAHQLGETVRHDTQVAGSAIKEAAHRVAVATKAVASEIAAATKRGAAKTRAAIRGEKSATSTTMTEP